MNNFKSKWDHVDFLSLMSCVKSNQENFNFLIRLMRRNVVIPFIGAGFSKNFGYPLWGEFLDKQADIHHLPEIGTAKKAYQYEKAATLLEERLGGSMEYTLMQSFGDHIYRVHSYDKQLDYLPRIFRNLILTTNFDEVIEMLYAKVNGEHIEKLTPKAIQDVKLIHKRIACGEPTLIKLHGDVALREFVLTEQAYNSVYGKHILDSRLPLPSFLRDVLLSRVLLFLGCSLEDDRTLQVIEQSQIDGSISFALLELPKETANADNSWKPILTEILDGKEIEKAEFTDRKAFLYAHNIIPIWFPYEEYDALKTFLSEIASQISTEYAFSTTKAISQVDNLLSEGEILKEDNQIEHAFHCYAGALEIIKANSGAFIDKMRLDYLNQIKSFYNLNGYAFECKEIIKEIILLTHQLYSGDSVELAMCYHDIGYAYERYQYYRLMLKTMQQSQEILQRCIEKAGEVSDTLNAAACIYISLAYAFLKSNDNESAKEWYQRAEVLLHTYEQSLGDDQKAFIYNGLYRYYKLLGDNNTALVKLEKALELRSKLYHSSNWSGQEKHEILNHIINTHSNKIRIYLETEQISEAEQEFQACKSEYPIWDRPEYLRDAKRRILTDHGDILKAKGLPDLADKEYRVALQYRKYLHFVDDYSAATIYHKIAINLNNISGRLEEAMEYMIQCYVIYENMLEPDNSEVQKIRKECEDMSERLSLSNKNLEQRLSAQREFLKYRYDERLGNRQDELIKYFDL